VWVTSHRGTLFYRIDPSTDKVVAQIDIGHEVCGQPGIGFGRLFVPPCGDTTETTAIDPATNQVVGTFFGGPSEMAIADGSIWTSLMNGPKGAYVRIDPASLNPMATTDVGGNTDQAVYGAGFIWLADIDGNTGKYGGTITKIDPATGHVVATFSTPDPGTDAWLTFAFGSLWLNGDDGPDLLKIDPKTGNVTTYQIPGYVGMTQIFETELTEGLGSLWMRMSDGTVGRVDPTNGRLLATYPADPAGGGGEAAVGFGSLWVANFGTDTVWRIRIQE
jgi:streptogramin lyase